MIISEQWLRDWIRVDLSAQEIADCLTNAGLEVDAVESIAGPIENLVVGKILTVEKHPDADRFDAYSSRHTKLRWDYGPYRSAVQSPSDQANDDHQDHCFHRPRRVHRAADCGDDRQGARP